MRTLIVGIMAATMLAGPVMAQQRGNDRQEWREDRQEFRDDRRDDRRDFREERREDRRDFRQDVRRDQNNWYRDQRQWRSVGRDDWRWAGQRFQAPRYVYPRGARYQAWGVGNRLPQAYFGQPYWIAQPNIYRLPPANRGARWVRVGPDALMINSANGLILQAVRGLW
ncbi:RcnB family protein [Polymorphobacter sp.]|uniref:RcnB family protein n=1 Tax=Polymorphobacter sp. TaxID=1909290 RepID=UPI003F6F0959